MAEDENTNQTAKPENEKKSPNILVIGLVSFLVTSLVTGSLFMIILNKIDSQKTTVENRGSQQKEKGSEIGELVPLGNELIINVKSEDGNDHYLKVNLTMEIVGEKGKEEKVKEEATKRIPQIRDLVISVFSSKTKEKIEEKEGKDQIRNEIIRTINRYLISGRVRNVFFEDFVLQ